MYYTPLSPICQGRVFMFLHNRIDEFSRFGTAPKTRRTLCDTRAGRRSVVLLSGRGLTSMGHHPERARAPAARETELCPIIAALPRNLTERLAAWTQVCAHLLKTSALLPQPGDGCVFLGLDLVRASRCLRGNRPPFLGASTLTASRVMTFDRSNEFL